MFTLNTFAAVGDTTNLHWSPSDLSSMPCGLFRCTLKDAYNILPELEDLYDSAPIPVAEFGDWEVDVKIHMLMAGQYPCIPNWHCDNVPRDENGITDYSKTGNSEHPMYLWISSGPNTEFLSRQVHMDSTPGTHADVANFIRTLVSREDVNEDRPLITSIPAQQWVSMDNRTPHRGTVATHNSWRVFARLTHRSIAPTRPVTSNIRRHCQVYLDATQFSW